MYMNPIFSNFSINVGKISLDWFYFTKQVSFWMRDDSLWANAQKLDYIFQGPFAVGTFSFHAPDLCGSTVACRWIPSSPFKTSMLWTGPAKPGPRYRRHPKTIILGHGNGDSRQISPIKNVNSLLSAAPSIFWEDPPKCLLGYEFYHVWRLVSLHCR